MHLRPAVIALLLTLSQPLFAATALIPLQHRTAEELLPAVQALLDEGETLAAHDRQLLVRASLERINELRSVVNQLDAPARQLLISLDTSPDQQPRYRVVTHPALPAQSGAPAPRILTAGQPHRTLQIRASEGRPAFVQLERSEPRLGFSADLDGLPYLQSQETESGIALQLVARLTGDAGVQLDLSARRTEIDPALYGARDTLLGETHVTGRLGEWIEITGEELTATHNRLATRSAQAQPLRIRVDALE
ncbi:secretin N-terminal domain-containing protein [Pseudomonas flexibilis]|uniref:NolW-like domain-containing protein n=1 Tax=Pseudomonas flexibilis TaxID=706570 RepID=A0A0B3BWA2_9PSED|nr:secretin N-terminal domain-containing protein [Pseudomonas flexibilis]KHO63657.1 hypothetical protein PT85_16410 [Pseudomonas flexibilis]SCY57605.1 type II/III secretion system short domain-containing protein [Pseudomonas flexibilis]